MNFNKKEKISFNYIDSVNMFIYLEPKAWDDIFLSTISILAWSESKNIFFSSQ